RFAPSPNGLLHLGHAASALINADWARATGGRMLLRIEDIDTGRARDHFIHQIEEDLAWLGIPWEEPVLHQSTRFAAYGAALDNLKEQGVLYPCFASRSELADAVADRPDWPRDPDGAPLCPGLWRDAPADAVMRARGEGLEPALRLNMARACEVAGLAAREPLTWREATPPPGVCGHGKPIREMFSGDPRDWGDVVVARRDIGTSYHLAVVVDDAAQGITHVVRGADLKAATAPQVLLQRLLGLPTPDYHHHGLVRDETGQKLSKSRESESLLALRESGVFPSDIRRRIEAALGAT
ncbi:MAG: tRNA glutamyl-Q(34) synthetase GluQRS, partial [Pseudomonadota bacterium]